MKIYIAAGHGGRDSGAVANGTNERDEVEKIVNETVTNLKTVLAGKAEIIQVPNELNVDKTPEWINQQDQGNTDSFCIEVHLNSNTGNPGSGIETYYGNLDMAKKIQAKLVEVLKLAGRGVREGNDLKFNRVTNPASCLTELGFINNPHDLEIIRERGSMALTKALYDLVSPTPMIIANPIGTEKGLLLEIKSALEQEIENIKQITNKIN